MKMNPIVQKAIEIALLFHEGQRYGELPYVVHLALVARHFQDPQLQAVAWLHDLLEDTPYVPYRMTHVFGPQISEAVEALTRKEEEPYLEVYIPRVGKNSLARLVKIADLYENLWSARHLHPEHASLIPRYEQALSYLQALNKKVYPQEENDGWYLFQEENDGWYIF